MATPIASGAICAHFPDHRFNGRENTSIWLAFPAKFYALTAKIWNVSGRALIIARMKIPTWPLSSFADIDQGAAVLSSLMVAAFSLPNCI